MPYKVYEQDGKWCLHKKNEDGSMGDLVPGGCHASKADAASHARAMYASEAKEFTDATLEQLKEIAGDADGDKPERANAVLDEWKARVALIPDEEVEEKGKGFDIEARKWAIDSAWDELFPRPQTEQPVTVASENRPYIIYYLDDAVIVSRDYKYYRASYTAKGDAIDIQPESEWTEVVKVSEWVAKSWGVNEEFEKKAAEQYGKPIPMEVENKKPQAAKKDLLNKLKVVGDTIKSWFKDEPDESELSIWKEGETYWWMARYSNNFRDNDNPPEIISSASHKRFVELVKEGKAPLPELWVWHKKEWKVGKAHGLAYDDSGFAVAIGTFDVGKEKVAEALLNSKERILVSHGMPVLSIKRDESDPTIIVEHETREISPLPAWAAANKLTGFAVLNLESKEESMSIPDETKKEWISKLGIKPETLESLESANAADADKAINEGLERKETEEEVAQPATQDTVENPAPVTEEIKAVSLTLEELQGVFQEGVAPLIERMNAIEAGMKELKEASEKREEVLKGTPAASLGALLGDFAKTAIGSPETRVDGRTSLAQSKPKETASIPGRTKIPFIDEMLAGNN